MEFLNWPNQKILTESGNSKNTCGACTDISMHNTSWAALCSGQMGVPLQWHAHDAWNQTGKTDIEDFYSNFNALASFIDGLDFETHRYKPSVQNEAYLFHQGGVLWDENNSNNDELNVVKGKNNTNQSVTFIFKNVLGETIWTKVESSFQSMQHFSLKEMEAGIYFLEIIQGQQKFVSKILITQK